MYNKKVFLYIYKSYYRETTSFNNIKIN